MLAVTRKPDNGCWQDLEMKAMERVPLVRWSCSLKSLWGFADRLAHPRGQSTSVSPLVDLDGEPAFFFCLGRVRQLGKQDRPASAGIFCLQDLASCDSVCLIKLFNINL